MEILVQNEYRMPFRTIASLVLNSLVIVSNGINDINHHLQEVSRYNWKLRVGTADYLPSRNQSRHKRYVRH